MTNTALVEKHYRSLVELSENGRELDIESCKSTLKFVDWFHESEVQGKREFTSTSKRRKFHNKLLNEHLAMQPPPGSSKKAIIMAGPPGAGKSHTRQSILSSYEDLYLVIDPDDFKELILKEMIKNGTYNQDLKPEEIKKREEQGEPFFPLDLAVLVHEESSILAARQRSEAIDAGLNIVIDTVLSTEKSANILLDQLTKNKYDIEIINVEATYKISVERVQKRWQEGYEKALKERGGLGGRWVPASYIQSLFSGSNSKSKSELLAQKLTENPSVKQYWLYRASEDKANLNSLSPWEAMMRRNKKGEVEWVPNKMNAKA